MAEPRRTDRLDADAEVFARHYQKLSRESRFVLENLLRRLLELESLIGVHKPGSTN